MAHFITQACTGCTGCVRYCPAQAIEGKRKLRHTIDAELCIDCGVCGRVCVARAVVDVVGKLVERQKPSQWVKPSWNYANCTGCGICVQSCPAKCLFLGEGKGVLMALPYLNKEQSCIGCSFCARSCPESAIRMLIPDSALMA